MLYNSNLGDIYLAGGPELVSLCFYNKAFAVVEVVKMNFVCVKALLSIKKVYIVESVYCLKFGTLCTRLIAIPRHLMPYFVMGYFYSAMASTML